jgi:hypothetical protein
MFKSIKIATVALAALTLPSQGMALVFNLTPTGNANADAGFATAASNLAAIFQDPVTVNITAGFAALPPGILGSAGSVQAGYNFGNWKTAMAGDAQSADDATMVGGLPGGPTFSRYINNTTDNAGAAHVNAGLNNVRLTNGNAKALGLLAPNQAGQDAQITFSSLFAWDFDPSDGIAAGAIDFVGVAMHELLHAMGFVSGVDILDINGVQQFSDAQFAPFVSGLDFLRFSDVSEAAGADIDWTADQRAKYYSIDGGTTSLVANAWSLGVNSGDGRQASHWKDNPPQLGIMDPTSVPAGQANAMTALDIQAMDVIGWDLQVGRVPLPSTLLLFGLGLISLRMGRRRAASA